mmetsp:Transcript_26076/g.75301  ORF Transcript_26076/g.75301 Transcript_26076/m.75301 type:complete len:226 (-) Transcript_26076:37-714(-)
MDWWYRMMRVLRGAVGDESILVKKSCSIFINVVEVRSIVGILGVGFCLKFSFFLLFHPRRSNCGISKLGVKFFIVLGLSGVEVGIDIGLGVAALLVRVICGIFFSLIEDLLRKFIVMELLLVLCLSEFLIAIHGQGRVGVVVLILVVATADIKYDLGITGNEIFIVVWVRFWLLLLVICLIFVNETPLVIFLWCQLLRCILKRRHVILIELLLKIFIVLVLGVIY